MHWLILVLLVMLCCVPSALGQTPITGTIGTQTSRDGPDLDLRFEEVHLACKAKQSCQLGAQVIITNVGNAEAPPSTLHLALDVPARHKRFIRPGELSSEEAERQVMACAPAVGSSGCETPMQCRRSEEQCRRTIRTRQQLFARDVAVSALQPGESWRRPLIFELHNAAHDILRDQRPVVEQLVERTLELWLHGDIRPASSQFKGREANLRNNTATIAVPYPR